MNILERVKLGCMDIDTQFKETDTVEEFDSNDGYKCTKKTFQKKDPPLSRNTTKD